MALRISQLLLLCWILLEPVWSRYVDREIRREIVLLIDDSASMHLIDEGTTKTRQELAEEILAGSGVVEALDGKVRVRTVRAARRGLMEDDDAVEGWDQATDIAGALESVLEQVPSD